MLSGPLPAGIENMTSVQKLFADDNFLSGPIPSLRHMKSLTKLRLHNNRLSGALPDGDLILHDSRTTLREIFLQGNRLTGFLPASFTHFTSLLKLDLSFNNFTGVISQLPASLTTLELHGPGNLWHCPFPNRSNSKIASTLKSIECACPPGSYCPLLGLPLGSRPKSCNVSCSLCTPGRFTNASYSSSTEDGSIGGRIESGRGCYGCAPGTAAAVRGASGCTPCPAGTTANSSASASCDACPKGRASNASSWSARISCAACSPGRFTPAPSTLTVFATPTDSGRDDPSVVALTSMLAGASACSSCTAGFSQPKAGQDACAACATGRFQDSRGQPTCQNCSVGTFSSTQGQAACTLCRGGRAQPRLGMSYCVDCVPGKAAAARGEAACTDCEPGSYAPLGGARNCTRCAFLEGLAQNRSGATSCEFCPGGTFSGDGTNCSLCPLGRGGLGSTEFRHIVYAQRPGTTLSVYQCTGCRVSACQNQNARNSASVVVVSSHARALT